MIRSASGTSVLLRWLRQAQWRAQPGRALASVAAVAIRRLSPAEAVLAGGRTAVDDHKAATVPWVTESDGAGLAERLDAHGG